MRFTATDKFNLYARGAVKTYAYTVSVRKTSSLSDALGTGTWLDATSYVVGMPPFPSRIEMGIGQQSVDRISLEGVNLAWWDANVFNATSSEYIEFKVTFILSQGSDVCTDTVYCFTGFADKIGVHRSELKDAVTFTVRSAMAIAEQIPGEAVTAQWLNADIDGGGTDGLWLPRLPYLYVKNAAVTSYLLKVGTHTITYDYNSGTERAKLDSGAWVTLSDGDNTLGNGASAGEDTERVVVYIADVDFLPNATGEITEQFVVTTEGNTIPRNWYRYLDVRGLLTVMFAKIGITDLTFDTMEISTATGGSKFSYLGIPGQSETAWPGKAWALVSDGTDLWIGVGNKLYHRATSTGALTLKATLTAGYSITRLWHSSANGHIWVLAQSGTPPSGGRILRHTISGATNSSEVSLTGASRNAIELYDNTWYGIVYADMTNHQLRGVDSSAMTDGLLLSQGDLGYSGTYGPTGNPGFVRSNVFVFQTADASGVYLHAASYVTGSWTDLGQDLTLTNAYTVAAFHVSEDRVYFYDPVANKIKSHTYTSATETDILTLNVSGEIIYSMQYLNSKVYWTTPKYGYVYEAVSNTATQIGDGTPRLHTIYHAFAYGNSRLYGLDERGVLYQYYTTVGFYVEDADFSGLSLKGAIQQVLDSFNLVGVIGSAKKAMIYRRGASDGTPQTSGNTLSVTVTDLSDLRMVKSQVIACGLVTVSNGTVVYSYNGSAYNTTVLSDVQTVALESPFIPDEIVQDLCKYIYEFFKTGRDLYSLTLGNVPLFQYEPFDGCSLTITGRNINKTASGPIYATTLGPGADMSLEVLL